MGILSFFTLLLKKLSTVKKKEQQPSIVGHNADLE